MEEWAFETITAIGRLGNMVSQEFRRQLEGYGLTTANILYRRPDHPWLLQTYVWQEYDLCPQFPELSKFLNFWLETLEGPLHSVTVAHARLIKPAEIRAIDAVLADGAGRARNLARQTMDAVKDVVGFVRSS